MPGIRIYAFAKKLGLDNKQLLDICEKVGIKGKGSALASLEEDEVAKVHQHIDGGESDSATAVSDESDAHAAPQRNDRSGPRRSSEMVDLDSHAKQMAPKSTGDEPEDEDEDEVEVEVEASDDQDEAPETPAAPTSTSDKAWSRPAPVQNKIAELGRPRPGSGTKKPAGQRKRPALNVKLAKMPDVKQPAASAKVKGEKVQKPEIALPKDGFKKDKDGTSGPLERYTDKTKEKKTKRKGRNAAPADDPAVLGQMPSSGKNLAAAAKVKTARPAMVSIPVWARLANSELVGVDLPAEMTIVAIIGVGKIDVDRALSLTRLRLVKTTSCCNFLVPSGSCQRLREFPPFRFY